MQRAIVNAPASARKLAFATRCSAPAPAPKVTGPRRNKETRMQVNLLPAVAPALMIGGVNPAYEFLKGQADTFSTLGLPEWLIHWGHPGNMFVVLLAMGGYGGWLGWQIRLSDDDDLITKAKDMHPKLAAGMAFFFLLGSTGGMMSLLMQGKPILSSTHAITGLTGLALLALQAMMPLFFQDDPNARSIHAYLGTGILALFVVHMGLGLQLGLSI